MMTERQQNGSIASGSSLHPAWVDGKRKETKRGNQNNWLLTNYKMQKYDLICSCQRYQETAASKTCGPLHSENAEVLHSTAHRSGTIKLYSRYDYYVNEMVHVNSRRTDL